MSSSKAASAQDVASHLRQALTSGDSSLAACRPILATFALKSTPEQVSELEEYLQEIIPSVDQHPHSDVRQFSTFIDALHILLRVLPPESIITTWFDLVLRSAFRSAGLSRESVRQAKELVLHGLSDAEGRKTRSFRRMLVDLYLHDVSNIESSKDDVIEHVGLDPAEQMRQKCWKANLEETLLADAIQRPEPFFAQINESFLSPHHRLQLIVLLSQVARLPDLSIRDFSSSPLFPSLLTSLQRDRSTTLVSVAISVLVMLLPQMASKSPEKLNESLPVLLYILCRVICWKERQVSGLSSPPSAEQKIENTDDWVCLESSFDLAAAPPPDARLYFQFLYGLWPTNVLSFLRRPVDYLTKAGMKPPPTGDNAAADWEDVIDVDELRSRATPILRTHIIHPSIMQHDSASELSDYAARWGDVEVSGLVSQCISLDVRNAAAASSSRKHGHGHSLSTLVDLAGIGGVGGGGGGGSGTATPREALKSVERAQEAEVETRTEAVATGLTTGAQHQEEPPIQELVATHVALKSTTTTTATTEIAPALIESTTNTTAATDITSSLHSSKFSPRLLPRSQLFESSSPSTPRSLPITPPPGTVSPRLKFQPLNTTLGNEVNALEVISSLQREVLLLRNELNFELWLKKQHLAHMSRLHRDRVVARSEEAERQSLHMRLKQTRQMLQQSLEEIKSLKASSAQATARQNEWAVQLQAKLARYREEKRSWANEATELRGEVSEAKAMVVKQKQILDETEAERFRLQTELHEIAPKIAQVEALEKKIEVLEQEKLLRDDSPETIDLKEQQSATEDLVIENAKLEMMNTSLAASNEELQKMIDDQRRNITELQRARASSPSSGGGGGGPLHRNSRSMSVSAMTVSYERFLALETEHMEIKTKNRELEETVEELEAMVDVLRRRDSRNQRRGSGATLSPTSTSMFGGPGSIDLGLP